MALLVLAAAPLAARGQGAFGQLCDAARGCDVNVPEPPAPTRVDVQEDAPSEPARSTAKARPAAPKLTTQQMVTMTLASSLFQGLFAPQQQDPAAAEAARQAQVEALRRRAEQVRGQRASRELENDASLEAMRSALADPFDVGGAPPAPLPGPAAVRLDPGATTVATFAPPENPFGRSGGGPAPGAAAADRLARLAAENEDVAKLAANLADLEGRLAEARARMVDLKRGFTWVAREYERHEETVARTVEDAKERGMSLALEGLFKVTPKAVDALEEVRANRGAWDTMVGLLRETDGAAQALKGAADFAGERADDLAWLRSGQDLRANLAFLGKRLGGPYYEAGESIVASALAVRSQLEAARGMRELSGVDAAYRRQLEELKPALADLERRTREAREAVARRTGLAADELKPRPEPQRGLGSEVPHPLDR